MIQCDPGDGHSTASDDETDDEPTLDAILANERPLGARRNQLCLAGKDSKQNDALKFAREELKNSEQVFLHQYFQHSFFYWVIIDHIIN